jgi:chloramphenicol 3-O-phosphotransferase
MERQLQFNKPTIIIFNGHSSSAKTSTIEIIQRYCIQPVFHLSVDSFFLSLGPKYLGPHSKEGFQFESYYKNGASTQDKLRTEIHYGNIGMAAIKALPHSLIYPYSQGLNCIADDVIYYKELMDNYKEVLKNTNTYFVHLYCDELMLMGRERYRFNRPLGLGIAQQELMLKQNFDYDIVIDNTDMTSEEVAFKIVNYINNNDPKYI